ncbi:MAG: glycine--tRNA ligase subunit beta [Limnochordia bacterium]
MRDLLLEIGTEELPAHVVDLGTKQLKEKAAALLAEHRIGHGPMSAWGTPRRLALYVAQVEEMQADLVEEVKGPPASVAFVEGQATKAALGFAERQGVHVSELVVKKTPQGEYVFAQRKQQGLASREILPAFLPQLIAALSFPKTMRWGAYDFRFPRPIRWLVALFGDEVVPFSIAGVDSGNLSWGHRFHRSGPVPVTASTYLDDLRRAYVIVDGEERRQTIIRQVEEVAKACGGQVLWDEDLLAEVTNLVEYPVAVWGEFGSDMLELPQEVLITPMKEHQRYFAVLNQQGELLPRFIAVANGGKDNLPEVRQGFERVLAARLADAKFFWEVDRKTPLEGYVEKLKGIMSSRKPWGPCTPRPPAIVDLAVGLAEELGWAEHLLQSCDGPPKLAKADLATNMVYEFPELQGVMGREYALRSGEPPAVAKAIYEHYLPRFAGDELPETVPGMIVSIADKMDSIAGCFAVGLIPTGSQDPYALRRQALGIIQIILTKELDLPLTSLIHWAQAGLADQVEATPQTAKQIGEFFLGRLRGILTGEGIRYDVIDAVLAVESDRLPDLMARCQAVTRALDSEGMARLLIACERVANLAAKADDRKVDPGLLAESAEKELYQVYRQVNDKVAKKLAAADYQGAWLSWFSCPDPSMPFSTRSW